MFNKVVTLAGKTFLIAVLFLLLNSTSISWAVKSTSKSVDNNNLNLVAQVSSNEYAQTADVTIRL